MKRLRHWTSRKFIAFAVTDLALMIGALIVRNGNFAALATGLVAAMGAFVGANVVADKVNKATATKDEGS